MSGNMQVLFNLVVISLAAIVCVPVEVVSEKVLDVPPYIKYAEDVIKANKVMKDDLTIPKSSETQEFIKLYTVVTNLVSQLQEYGKENAYPDIYMDTVTNTLDRVSKYPIDAYYKLRDLISRTNDELNKIMVVVLHTELTKCKVPQTHECDSIIESELKKDVLIYLKKGLLIAAGKHATIFMDVSNRFKNAGSNAENFLVNGSDVMKPLVMATFETIKQLYISEMKPIDAPIW